MKITIGLFSFFVLSTVLLLSDAIDYSELKAVALGDCENHKLLVRLQAKGFMKRMSVDVHVYTQDGSISLLRSTRILDDGINNKFEVDFLDINNVEDLSCEVYINDTSKSTVFVPCTIIRDPNCSKIDYLMDSGETRNKKISRDLINEEDMFYNVTVRTIQNCDKLRGTVVAKVKTSRGKSVRRRNVSFLLVGEKSSYTGLVNTDGNGRAIFRFDVLPDDVGKDLWCSIAISNPNLPFAQQVPCGMKFDC